MSATGESSRGLRESEAGTTLLEALVVLTLMVMIGGLMFPSLQRMLKGVALAETRSGVAADLRLARARAITSGAPVTWTVSPDGGAYAWSGAGPRSLLPGVRISGAVSFYPDGSTAGAGVRLDSAPLPVPF